MADDSQLERLEQHLGHTFRDRAPLIEALTHPSVDPQARGGARHGYQRLEFLGDRVLGLLIAEWLLERYGDEPEGALSRRSSALVREETLAEVAQTIGLGDHVRLSTGEREQGGRDKRAILADVAEAVIGAIYQDGGLDAARALVRHRWADLMSRDPVPPKDAKTALQEWAQARGLPLPAYRVVGRSGADHAPQFTVEVTLAGTGQAEGRAGSKRQAERKAAAALLNSLAAP